MELLNRKNYCLILLGAENHSIDDILRISETTPNTMAYNSQDVIVATFSSYLNIREITDYIKSYDVNFFIFDINDKNFGRNITDEETDNELFSFISGPSIHIPKSNSFSNEDIELIRKSFKSIPKIKIDIEDVYDEEDVEETINLILDKGYKNITEGDKKFIQRLINK
jgi:ATP-dependent RNA circularization protein (DNA/RNA ligase family)